MRRFQWKDLYEIDLPGIDGEHRTLFRIADELDRARAAGLDAAAQQAIVRALATHTIDHFAHEERLVQASRYPLYGWHRGQHDTARARVKDILPKIEGGDPVATRVLLLFLFDWLRSHIRLTDRMMAAYLRNYARERKALAS
jgi:hemerythrin